jgi:hypothetical protein
MVHHLLKKNINYLGHILWLEMMKTADSLIRTLSKIYILLHTRTDGETDVYLTCFSFCFFLS